MKIVICSGGFDPLHCGHIEYLKASKLLGDMLIVGVNSDAWLERKKGAAFMPLAERLAVVENLRIVDQCITFNDNDGSAIEAIRLVKKMHPNCTIIFANGGDRTKINIPEMGEADVEFVFGVGGNDKKNSSSWILDNWKNPKTQRAWGFYQVLHKDGKEIKVKQLTVEPGKSLSMQRHQKRGEFWFVASGTATVYTINRSTDLELRGRYKVFENLWIDPNEWHQLTNEGDEPLKLIEIQYGEECEEEDIERK